MKFSDLKFEPHYVIKGMDLTNPMFTKWANHTQAIWEQNDIRISITFGKMFYSNGIDTYELMIMSGADDEPASDEPLGHLTEQEVEDEINRVCNGD